MPCDEKMEVHLHQEIIDSIKECLWNKWVPAQPEDELRQSPGSVPRLDPQAEFQARVCSTYDWFMDVKWGSCEEALAIAWDAHQQVLAAAALLEDKIKRLSHSCSGSCISSGSCQQRRPQNMGCETQVPQVTSCHGDSARRWAELPSPSWLRQQITFANSSPESSLERDTGVKEPHLPTWGDKRGPGSSSNWFILEEDLWCLPPLDPHTEGFLGREEMPPASAELRVQLPVNLDFWALPPEECWVDEVACTTTQHTDLVVRTFRGSKPRWHPGIHKEGVGILSGTQGKKPHVKGR